MTTKSVDGIIQAVVHEIAQRLDLNYEANTDTC